MHMELNRKALKAKAREQMRQAAPSFIQVTLVYLMLTTILFLLLDLMGVGPSSIAYQSRLPFLPLFLSLLTYLYSLVIAFGYQWWGLKIFRQQQTGYGTLIDGFGMAGRVLLLQVMISLRILGWVCLVMFPAILVLTLLSTLSKVLFLICYSLFLISLYILITVISYRYVLAPYLLMDQPERGVENAIRTSVTMMRGWIWTYFKLDLSFLGWRLLNLALISGIAAAFILPVLLSGQVHSIDGNMALIILSAPLPSILLTLVQFPVNLWLMPYYSVTTAGFYTIRSIEPTSVSTPYTYHDVGRD